MVYVYDWKPIREIVIIGELLAVSAIVMCTLFVMVDIGQPAANTSRPASLTEHGIRLRLFLAFFEPSIPAFGSDQQG